MIVIASAYDDFMSEFTAAMWAPRPGTRPTRLPSSTSMVFSIVTGWRSRYRCDKLTNITPPVGDHHNEAQMRMLDR